MAFQETDFRRATKFPNENIYSFLMKSKEFNFPSSISFLPGFNFGSIFNTILRPIFTYFVVFYPPYTFSSLVFYPPFSYTVSSFVWLPFLLVTLWVFLNSLRKRWENFLLSLLILCPFFYLSSIACFCTFSPL